MQYFLQGGRLTINYQKSECLQQSRHPWHLEPGSWIPLLAAQVEIDDWRVQKCSRVLLQHAEGKTHRRAPKSSSRIVLFCLLLCTKHCDVEQQPTGTRHLFSMPGPSRLQPTFCTSRPEGVLVCLEKCDALSVWAVTLVFKWRYELVWHELGWITPRMLISFSETERETVEDIRPVYFIECCCLNTITVKCETCCCYLSRRGGGEKNACRLYFSLEVKKI